MDTIKSDVIGGYNSFIKEQSKVDGECDISLYQFDDEYETTYKDKDIQRAPKLNNENYVPRGWTKLLDAIGKTINSTGETLANLKEKDRPAKVLMVIFSDGQENKSTEFTREQIFKMIKHQTDKYKWEFCYLGANQDAIAVAESYGISADSTLHFASNSIGTKNLYTSLNSNITRYRTTSSNVSFSDKDREEQKKAGAIK